MKILELQLTSIEVGSDRAREIDPAWVEGLAASIREQGLMQPILVRAIDGQSGRYRLIAGWHRIEAFRLLGRNDIPAVLTDAESDDAAKLAEDMENLARHGLIALDRCHHLYELKQVWERMYPETKAGVAGGKARQGSANEIFSFAAATAERIGLSQRAIQIAVKIWTGLAPQVRNDLQVTKLADNQDALETLSDLPAKKQEKVLELILDEDLPDITSVKQALDYLSEGVVPDPLEKRFETVRKSILSRDDATFDSVIAACEDRVIASLKRRDRI